MASSTTERDALTSRVLPQMVLSTGDPFSMTGPPPPMPHYLSAEGRAIKRFAVEGNAIITGGAGTLALVNARALLEHGLSGLALFDIRFEGGAAAEIELLRKDFPTVLIRTCHVNVIDEGDVRFAMHMMAEKLGSVDILCCFAGVVSCVDAVEMTAEEWRKTLDVNTTGAFLCAQAVAKHQIRISTPCAILFIASISAHRTNYPQPQAAYNASKAALLSLKSSLAAEWARHGIRVNSISPGYMDTVLNAGPGLAHARGVWKERNPMGRLGEAEELTGAVVLLCGAAGSYITGADLVVDGGQICF